MELWDLYDCNMNPTGEIAVRGSAIPTGRYHLVAHVCIFNSEGQMLIQHRLPTKIGWPDRWDLTVVGSAVSGDTIQKAAEREVSEEIGYELDLNDIPLAMTLTYTDSFSCYYLVEREIDLNSLTLQPTEVDAVKWATLDDIHTMIDQESFIPYPHALIDLIFQRRKFLFPHMMTELQEYDK